MIGSTEKKNKLLNEYITESHNEYLITKKFTWFVDVMEWISISRHLTKGSVLEISSLIEGDIGRENHTRSLVVEVRTVANNVVLKIWKLKAQSN